MCTGGRFPACRSWWQYAMFVTYFPELIAGPIVRAKIFLPQMTRSLRPSWPRAWVGLQLILLGVSEKTAGGRPAGNPLRQCFCSPKPVFAAYGDFGGFGGLLDSDFYCDFSGYSDIAIEFRASLDSTYLENFFMPYLATSVTEFWRRWHMTLSPMAARLSLYSPGREPQRSSSDLLM